MDEVRIVAAEERYCASHTETISMVAREGKYLSNNTGFSYEAIVGFFRMCADMGYPQYYVINERDEAVGWCDIIPREATGRRIGYIGVGLRPEYRERGIGTRLMQYALERAKDYGFSEIRLDCRASNKRAIHVYKKKLGFRLTGYKRRGMTLDGETIPLVFMKKKLK